VDETRTSRPAAAKEVDGSDLETGFIGVELKGRQQHQAEAGVGVVRRFAEPQTPVVSQIIARYEHGAGALPSSGHDPKCFRHLRLSVFLHRLCWFWSELFASMITRSPVLFATFPL
jgi:hypothetical protein